MNKYSLIDNAILKTDSVVKRSEVIDLLGDDINELLDLKIKDRGQNIHIVFHFYGRKKEYIIQKQNKKIQKIKLDVENTLEPKIKKKINPTLEIINASVEEAKEKISKENKTVSIIAGNNITIDRNENNSITIHSNMNEQDISHLATKLELENAKRNIETRLNTIKNGKSAFDSWKEMPKNRNKTIEDFFEALKGERGLRGESGRMGKDGVGIKNVTLENDTLTVELSNGNRKVFSVPNFGNAVNEIKSLKKIQTIRNKNENCVEIVYTNGSTDEFIIPLGEIDTVKEQVTNLQSTVQQTSTYVHVQNLSSKEWIVNHPMNRYPAVTIIDSSGNEVHGEVQYLSDKQVVIRFNYEFSGKAILS